MNSKAEYNRCEIARLVLGDAAGGVDEGEDVHAQEQAVREWVRDKAVHKMKNPEVERVKKQQQPKKSKMKRGMKEDDVTEDKEDDLPKKKRKRTYHHQVLDGNWGKEVKVVAYNLPNIGVCIPQPQRMGCRLRGNRATEVGRLQPGPTSHKGMDIRQYLLQGATVDSVPPNQFCDREDIATFGAIFGDRPTPNRPSRRSRRKEGASGPITSFFKRIIQGGGGEERTDTTPPMRPKRKLLDSGVQSEEVVINTKRRQLLPEEERREESFAKEDDTHTEKVPGLSHYSLGTRERRGTGGENVTDATCKSLQLSSPSMCSTQLSSHSDGDETLVDESLVDDDIKRCGEWMTIVSDRLMILKCVEKVLDDVMCLVTMKQGGGGDDTVSVVSVSGRHPVSAQPQSESGTMGRVQEMFGGAVMKKKQVRSNNTPNKKCVRSKMNRCLVHRCPFLEEEKSRRVLSRGEDGRIEFKMIVETVWRCSTQQKEEGSVSGNSSIRGGYRGGRIVGQNGSIPHGQEVNLQPSSSSADAVRTSNMEEV